MPIRVQLPNGQIAEFPDGMQQEQIQAAIAGMDPMSIAPRSSNVEQTWDAVAGRPVGGVTKAIGAGLDFLQPDRAAPVVLPMDEEDYENVGSPLAWGANLKNAVNRGAEIGAGLMGAGGRLLKRVGEQSIYAPGATAVGDALQRPEAGVREERADLEEQRKAQGRPSLMGMDRGEGDTYTLGTGFNISGKAVEGAGQQVVDTHTTAESAENARALGAAWEDGILEGLGFMVRNPIATADVTLPSLIEFGIPGGAVGRGVRANLMEGAVLSAERAAARVASEGGDALAQAAARTDAMIAGTKAARDAAGTASAAVQAGQSAGTMGAQAGNEIRGMSPEELAKFPGFNDLAAQVGFDRAREIVAKQAEDATLTAAGTINLGTYIGAQRLGLNPFDTRIAGGQTVAGAAASKAGMAGRVARAGVHGAQESAGEFVQGAGEQLGQNLGMGAADSRVDPLKGVLSSGVMEAAVGGTVGGLSGLTTGATAKPADPIVPGSPVDNAAPKPDASTPEGQGAAIADGLMREAGVGNGPPIKVVTAEEGEADAALDALAAPYAPDQILEGQDNADSASAALGAATAAPAVGPAVTGGNAPAQVATPPASTDAAPGFAPPRADYEAPNFGQAPWPVTVPDTDPLWAQVPGGETVNIDSPERTQLREQIVKQHFRGVTPVAATEGRKPIAYVMGGGGASGKGTLLAQLQASGQIPSSNIVELDPDRVKTGDRAHGITGIPEYAQLIERGDSRAAHVAHEESSAITAKVRQIATAGGYDMVIDRTLGDPKKARAELEALKRAGYEVRLFGITLDADKAVERAYARATGRGRYVPTEAMLKAHRGFAEGFESYIPYVDSAELYDNSGEVPTLLARKAADGTLEIDSEEGFQRFTNRRGINEKAVTYRELAESDGTAPRAQAERAGAQPDQQGAVGSSKGVEQREAGSQGGQDSEVAIAAAEADTEASDAQKEAGNYRKGHIAIGGLDIAIETPAGARRRPEWPPLKHAYGYVKRTLGFDGDQVDVFLSDNATDTSLPVFIVDQNNKSGGFDEHKVMMGFATEAEARAAYLSNYGPGWNGLGAITEMSFDQFKDWVHDEAATQVRAADNPTDDLTTEITRILEEQGVTGAAKMVTVVDSIDDLSDKLRSTLDGDTDGIYDPRTGHVFLIRGALPTDKRAALDRATWVVWHEIAGHLGLRRAFPNSKALEEVLTAAGKNPTVSALADAIVAERGDIDRMLAIEEALAELAAAQRTGNYAEIESRYGIEIPTDRTGIAGIIARVIKALKQAIARARGEIPYSDRQVRELLEAAMDAARRPADAPREAAPLQSRAKVPDRSSTGMFTSFAKARKMLGLKVEGNNGARDVGVALNKWSADKFGAIDAADREASTIDKLGAAMASEVSHQLRASGEATGSGVGWYSNNYPNAVKRLAKRFPELADDAAARNMFTALLAITSNGEKVRRNLTMATEMYAGWREGKALRDVIPNTRRADALADNVEVLEQLEERFGYEGLADHLMSEMTVSQINAELRARGEKPSSAYTADMVLPRAALYFGPKLGAFYANLAGSDGYLTMDLWWSRSFNRYRANLVPQPTESGLARVRNMLGLPEDATQEEIVAGAVPHWKSYVAKNFKNGTELEKASNTLIKAAMLELNEAPENARDRRFMYEVAKNAQQRLAADGQSVSVADIQAALWYYEKRLYAGLGVRGRDDIGYEEAINAIADESDRPVGSFARGSGSRGRGQYAGRAGSEQDRDVRPLQSRRAGDGSRRDPGRGAAQGADAPLAGAPRIRGATGPDPRLVKVAERYARSIGLELTRQSAYATVDEARAARIADAYAAMEHAPQDARVRAAYDDLIAQTIAQYRALEDAGYRFWLMDPAADPYDGNPWNAMRDLRANQSMAVFPTDAGFGSSDLDVNDNPLLADTGIRWPYGSPDGATRPVLANDLFRAVHDAFGHGLEGAGFRADGEENAWQAHVRLFKGPAVGAITSETRGQNSWLNYGPNGEANRTAKVEDTVFADQKTGLMPEWTWNEGRLDAPLQSRKTPADAMKERNKKISGLQRQGYQVQTFVQSGSTWNQTVRTRREALFHEIRRVLQDRMIGVRSALRDIEAAIGGPIDEAANIYRAENLMHGKAADRIRRVREGLVDPLKAMIKASGIPVADIEQFLWAQHALERNKRIAKINPAMPDAGSGLSNADAQAIIAAANAGPHAAELKKISDKVQELRMETLHTLRNSGQITPDQFVKLRGMYRYYIPLRGHDGVEGEARVGSGRGVDMRGKPVQRALGRKGRPANILGEMVGDLERAQVQAAKAEVGRTLLRAALEHPNPDYWQVERVTTEQKFSEASGEVYTAIVNDLTDEETIIVKHRGVPYRVRLVDPDLRKAMFNLGVEGFESVAKYLGWVNRWLSAVFTRFNPAFVPVNMLRDMIQGSIGVGSELGGKALAQVATLYPKAAAGLYAEARGAGDASVPDAQKSMADWAREFLESGAATGYQTFADAGQLQQQIELEMAGLLDIVKQGKPLAAVSEAVRRSKTMQTIEVANEIIENSMRLSVYVQRRRAGVSRAKAAEYAKNLTVNFNRKGAGSAIGNALFLFFNASMQGSHRTLRLMKDPRVLGGLAAAGALQFAIAITMGAARYEDDDETLWEQIPDHVRQKGFVIPLGFDEQGGPQYVAIPMPFGFNLFTYAGGYPALLASPTWRSRRNPVKQTMGDIARAGIDAFSVVPVGEEGWYFPTVVRIFSNLQANRDDLGRKIRDEGAFEKFERPRASQGKADTPALYKDIANALNRIGGGDDYTKPVTNLLDWAPEDIEYLMSTFTGGPGTMIQQMWRSGERMGAGLPTRLDDIPVARRVVGSQSKAQVDSTAYYDTAEVMERGLERLRDRYAGEGEAGFYALRTELGPQFAGVELARYKTNDKDGEYVRGQVKTSADGTPTLDAIAGTTYKAYKDAAKVVKGYGSEIRRSYNDDSLDRLERRRRIDQLQTDRAAAMRSYLNAWNATLQ